VLDCRASTELPDSSGTRLFTSLSGPLAFYRYVRFTVTVDPPDRPPVRGPGARDHYPHGGYIANAPPPWRMPIELFGTLKTE
jgi:hypothetical protein